MYERIITKATKQINRRFDALERIRASIMEGLSSQLNGQIGATGEMKKNLAEFGECLGTITAWVRLQIGEKEASESNRPGVPPTNHGCTFFSCREGILSAPESCKSTS